MGESSSRTASFLKNSFWSLLLMAVNTVAAFIIPRAIIGCYGSAVNGLVNSITQLISYVTLVEAGIGAAAVFALYKPLAAGDKELVSDVVTEAKRFYYRSGLVFTFLVVVMATIYPFYIDAPGLGPLDVAILVLSLGATGFLDFFTLAKYQVLLTASQRNWAIQIASIVYKVVYVIVVLALTSLGMPVVTVYVVAVGAIVLRSCMLVIFTKRVFPDVSFTSKRRYRLEQHWDAFYLQVLGVVQSGAPILIATFLLKDLNMVSVFSVYQLVATGIQSIGSAFSNGTQASFGDVIARGQSETLKKAFSEFQTALYSFNGFLCGVSMALVVPFVALYAAGVTDADYIQPAIGFLCILNVFLWQLKTPQGLLVISAGHYRQTRIQTTAQTVILLVCSTLFGHFWGIEGILIGSCLSNFYRDIDLMFYVPRHIVKTSVASTALKMLQSCLVVALIVVPWELVNPGLCSSWGEWLVCAAVLCCWGGVVAFVVCLACQRNDLLSLTGRLKRVIR